MGGLYLGLFVLVLAIMGCTKTRHDDNPNSSDSVSNQRTLNNTDLFAEGVFAYDSLLLSFKAVVDTLNSVEDNLVHYEYFLHDITGDKQPELWIISGTYEADKELWFIYERIGIGNGMYTECFATLDLDSGMELSTNDIFKTNELGQVKKLLFRTMFNDKRYREWNQGLKSPEEIEARIEGWQSPDPILGDTELDELKREATFELSECALLESELFSPSNPTKSAVGLKVPITL